MRILNLVKSPASLGMLLLSGAMSVSANAQCGMPQKAIKPSAWHMNLRQSPFAQAELKEGSDSKAAPTIVGMWHVTFTAHTMNGANIPDTVIDSAIVVWHADGTEIMNSGRPPQDGNFCLGVWEQTDPLTYRLNHFAWAGNNYAPGTPNGVVGEPIGPVRYQEDVVLGPAGKRYSGIFSLDQYDTTGHVAVSFTGTMKATRITLDTKASDLL